MINKDIGTTYINGIYLTPSAINILDYLQTGGTIGWDKHDRKFTNEGINSIITDLEKARRIIIKEMLSETIENEECILILRLIEEFSDIVQKFAAPKIKIKN